MAVRSRCAHFLWTPPPNRVQDLEAVGVAHDDAPVPDSALQQVVHVHVTNSHLVRFVGIRHPDQVGGT